MKKYLLTALVALGSLVVLTHVQLAQAGEALVKVQMLDKGYLVTPNSVPAGEVTFKATNATKTNRVHEMVVVKVKSKSVKLPYSKEDQRVDEDKLSSLGEVSETMPGQSGSLTLHMKPGLYELFSNQPNDYADGEFGFLTVK